MVRISQQKVIFFTQALFFKHSYSVQKTEEIAIDNSKQHKTTWAFVLCSQTKIKDTRYEDMHTQIN